MCGWHHDHYLACHHLITLAADGADDPACDCGVVNVGNQRYCCFCGRVTDV